MEKKNVVVLLLLTFCFYLFSLDAEVISTKGRTEFLQGSKWMKVKEGDKLKKGNLVSTGFKSEITLRIDGSVIVVQPLTRLKIEDIAKKNDVISSNVFINVGSIKANIKPASTKKVNFKVKTPVATASVRGTSGLISADGKLIGSSGTWAYSNNLGEETYVKPGHIVIIDDKGMIIPTQNTMTENSKEVNINSLADSEKRSFGIMSNSLVSEYIEAELPNSEVIVDISWED